MGRWEEDKSCESSDFQVQLLSEIISDNDCQDEPNKTRFLLTLGFLTLFRFENPAITKEITMPQVNDDHGANGGTYGAFSPPHKPL